NRVKSQSSAGSFSRNAPRSAAERREAPGIPMRYFVLLFLCAIAVIAYIQRTGVNAVKGLICGDVGINTEEFGAVGTAWLIGYAILQVPAGWLADRIGP